MSVEDLKAVDQLRSFVFGDTVLGTFQEYFPGSKDYSEALNYLRAYYQKMMFLGSLFCRADASKRNFDAVITESFGARSQDVLSQHGSRPFSLGAASKCLVVGLYDEDVGIAGPHRIVYTLGEMLSVFGGFFSNRHLEVPALEVGTKTIATHLAALVRAITQEAMGAFTDLSGGEKPMGAKPFIYGAHHLSPLELDIVRGSVRGALEAGGFSLPFSPDFLGQMGQIVLGGRNHLFYPIPTFIPDRPAA